MGYDTQFAGWFDVHPLPLDALQVAYLRAFAKSRRQTYDNRWLATHPEGVEGAIRDAVGLPLGDRGDFYVGELGGIWAKGQLGVETVGIIDANVPPGQRVTPSAWTPHPGRELMPYQDKRRVQPGLGCQWVPNELGTVIEWDQNEKFYDYIEWLEYLCHTFLAPWGHFLDGVVRWRGEEFNDIGQIEARVSVHPAKGTTLTVRDGDWFN